LKKYTLPPKIEPGRYLEIATGVHCLEAGKGISRSNVYFVQAGVSWVLIDAASANCSRLIRETAGLLFGANTRPASIILTHDHPDHAGSALELARMWGCPVYVHSNELPLATLGDISIIEQYANPIDRYMILPILHVMPRRRVESMFLKSSLKDVVQGFDTGAAVPSLPEWECVPTPGHTPGHVSFFRTSDRFLITGDAIVTVDLNSFWGFLLWSLRVKKQRISGAPWYSTWNKRLAWESIVTLAGLKPRVLASGHGQPMTGDSVAVMLHTLADRFAGIVGNK
jgi:glyoxylase-like metal-dependent hydrolase (beta-lactamase superfamily II)